jgi:hypothetical protein
MLIQMIRITTITTYMSSFGVFFLLKYLLELLLPVHNTVLLPYSIVEFWEELSLHRAGLQEALGGDCFLGAFCWNLWVWGVSQGGRIGNGGEPVAGACSVWVSPTQKINRRQKLYGMKPGSGEKIAVSINFLIFCFLLVAVVVMAGETPRYGHPFRLRGWRKSLRRRRRMETYLGIWYRYPPTL